MSGNMSRILSILVASIIALSVLGNLVSAAVVLAQQPQQQFYAELMTPEAKPGNFVRVHVVLGSTGVWIHYFIYNATWANGKWTCNISEAISAKGWPSNVLYILTKSWENKGKYVYVYNYAKKYVPAESSELEWNLTLQLFNAKELNGTIEGDVWKADLSLPYLGNTHIDPTTGSVLPANASLGNYNLSAVCVAIGVCGQTGCNWWYNNVTVLPYVIVKPRIVDSHPCSVQINVKARSNDDAFYIHLLVYGAPWKVNISKINILNYTNIVKSYTLSQLETGGYVLGGSLQAGLDGVINVSLKKIPAELYKAVGKAWAFNITIALSYTGLDLSTANSKIQYQLFDYSWRNYDSIKLAAFDVAKIVAFIGSGVQKYEGAAAYIYGKWTNVSSTYVAALGIPSGTVNVRLKPDNPTISGDYVISNVNIPNNLPVNLPNTNMTGGDYTLEIINATSGAIIDYDTYCSIYRLHVMPLVEIVGGDNVAQPAVENNTLVVENADAYFKIAIYGFSKNGKIHVITENGSVELIPVPPSEAPTKLGNKITTIATLAADGNATVYVCVPLNKSLVGGRNIVKVTDGVFSYEISVELLPTAVWKKLDTALNGLKLPADLVDVVSSKVSAGHPYYGQVILVGKNGNVEDYLGDVIYIDAYAIPANTTNIYVYINATNGNMTVSIACPSLPCVTVVPPLTSSYNYTVIVYFNTTVLSGANRYALARFYNTTYYIVTNMSVAPKIILVNPADIGFTPTLGYNKTIVVKMPVALGSIMLAVVATGYPDSAVVTNVLINGTDALLGVNSHIKNWRIVNGTIVSTGNVTPGLVIPVLQPGVYAIEVLVNASVDTKPGLVIISNNLSNVATKEDVEKLAHLLNLTAFAMIQAMYQLYIQLNNVYNALYSSIEELKTLVTESSSKILESISISTSKILTAINTSTTTILTTINESLAKVISEATTNLNKIASTIEDVEKLISETLDKVSSIESDIKEAIQDINKISDKVEKAVSEAASKIVDEVSTALKSQLSTAISDAVKEIKGSIEAIVSENLKNVATKSDLSAVASKLSTAIDTINSIKSDLGTVRGDLSTVKSSVEGLKSEISNVKSALSNVQQKLGSVEGKIGSLESKEKSLESAVGGLQTLIIVAIILALIAAATAVFTAIQISKKLAG